MTPASKRGEGTAAREEKIGFTPVLAFAVGAMVGGGVFTLSGTGIDRAGPAALLSYALAGLIMFVSALAFVAVAARAKKGESIATSALLFTAYTGFNVVTNMAASVCDRVRTVPRAVIGALM